MKVTSVLDAMTSSDWWAPGPRPVGSSTGAVIPLEMGGRLDQVTMIAARSLLAIAIYLACATLVNIVAQHTGIGWLQRVVRLTTPRLLTSLLIGVIATAGPAGAQVETTGPTTTDTTGTASLRANDPPVMLVMESPPSTPIELPWLGDLGQNSDSGSMRSSEKAISSNAQVDLTTSTTTPDEPVTDQQTDPINEATSTPTSIVEVPVTSADDATVTPSSPAVHTVAAGEHFWSIAEAVLTRSGIENPDDSSIARYWSTLIDANRDRLVQPDNPDLIMPGQQLIVPPVG